MSNLVEQLRNVGWHDCNHHLAMEAAADLIESQQATIKQLVEALREQRDAAAHAEFFIRHREIMHSAGVSLFQETLEASNALLSKLKEQSK